jgi:biopolymer transport protein ExbB
VLSAGLRRAGSPLPEIEKAVEDAGSREVRKLNANLRPLSVVITIAPLLGLLGTVWGMVVAFIQIASAEGLGKPEQLADGISQALITTVAGLVIAIPTQAAYYWFRGRIDRWVREAEAMFDRFAENLRAVGATHANS